MPRRHYCGYKSRSPSGAEIGTDARQCAKQVRRFGRRMVPDDQVEEWMGRDGDVWSDTGSGCGRRGGARMSECRRHFRLYGVLPVLESADDLVHSCFVATARADLSRTMPRVRPDHGYTDRVLSGDNVHSRDARAVVFVSVAWRGAGREALASPDATRGGVGFAVGYFPPTRRRKPSRRADDVAHPFHIVRVHVNPPYRRGPGATFHVAAEVVRRLVEEVGRQGASLLPPGSTVRCQVDPNAPCFQLNNREYMTARQARSLIRMYEEAGFDVLPATSGLPSRVQLDVSAVAA